MSEETLKNVSLLITKGTTPTTIGERYSSHGINYIKSESIKKSKFLDRELFEHIDEVTNNKLRRSIIKENDLLFSIAGIYLGKICLVTKDDLPANTNQAVAIVRLDPNKVDVNYIYYYFSQNYINKFITKQSSQSSQPNLNLDLLGSLKFDLKDLSEQKKISSFLNILDKKIYLNEQINKKLESICKLIYDYWFVQFDFPNIENKSYKTNKGKMKWNDEIKREIPANFYTVKLKNLEKNIITGKTPSTDNKEYYNGSIPFICIDDIRDNIFVINTTISLSTKGANTQKNKYIKKDSICVTCIGTAGLIGFASKDAQTNQQINSIVCENIENKNYLYFYLKDYFKFSKPKSGNILDNMNKEEFSEIIIIKPEDYVLKKFSDTTNPIMQKIYLNCLENEKLSKFRDLLNLMLMNGQVKIN